MGTPADEIILDEVIGSELFGAGVGEAAAGAAAAEAAAPAAAEAAAPGMVDVMGGTEAAMASSPAGTLDMADVLANQISQTPYGRGESIKGLGDFAGPVTGLPQTVSEADIEALANLGGTPEQLERIAVEEARQSADSFDLESFLNKYGKYGALGGLGLMGGLQARGLAKQAGKLRSELGDLSGAKQALATGQEMVAGAKAGQLLPGQDAAVQQFRSDKMAQLESYLQRAGIRDSSSAAALRNQVENQVQNYRQTLLQANLNQGMQLMGVSDAATAAAIKAGYGANADAANLAMRYATAAAQVSPFASK